jgi:hypothetical protein
MTLIAPLGAGLFVQLMPAAHINSEIYLVLVGPPTVRACGNSGLEEKLKIYKRHSPSTSPVYARLDGKGCWLSHKPLPNVTEAVSFRAILRNGPSDNLIRSFELGTAGEYYSSICRGIGERDLINLYSSEQEARQHYEDAVGRCNKDSHWQRI